MRVQVVGVRCRCVLRGVRGPNLSLSLTLPNTLFVVPRLRKIVRKELNTVGATLYGDGSDIVKTWTSEMCVLPPSPCRRRRRRCAAAAAVVPPPPPLCRRPLPPSHLLACTPTHTCHPERLHGDKGEIWVFDSEHVKQLPFVLKWMLKLPTYLIGQQKGEQTWWEDDDVPYVRCKRTTH